MQKYASALAYIDVETQDGIRCIGSCFHAGEGVFVTARHVIEGASIVEIKLTEPVAVTTEEFFSGLNEEAVQNYDNHMSEVLGEVPRFKKFQSSLTIECGPYFHPDPRVDVAVFKVSSVHRETSVVRLGSHLDDWIARFDWQLSEGIVLGYPPIPLTSEPHLVAVRAEVNAVINLYSSRHVHFILSAIPRGGFSGGLALSEYDFALGLIAQSLLKDYRSEETGFFAVLSVEPIYECLSHHKLLPAIQKEGWDDFWNTSRSEYVYKENRESIGKQLIVSLIYIDDGGKVGIGVCSYNESIFNELIPLIKSNLPDGFNEIIVHKTFNKYTYAFTSDDLI
ncbi:MAG: hypothetical protein GC149_13375 [Gammaproteobacteria bacterium]|nr:hypothetical protein [Gammaproteobacteria bacterium]